MSPIPATRTIQSDTLAVRAERLARPTLDIAGSITPLLSPADPVDAFEARLAALEGGRWSLAFRSGAQAAEAVIASIPRGASIVAGLDLGPIVEAQLATAESRGVEITRIDATDPVAVAGALRTTTRLLWLAAPAGATLALPDIRAVATIARLAGVRVAVDNSAWTAAILRPLELGADLVVYTRPAALVGSSEGDLGVIIGRSGDFRSDLAAQREWLDAIPTPEHASRALLGLETLPLRSQKQELTALLLARRLEENPHIRRVFFAGLDSSPQRALARRQARGLGALLSIELRGGPARVNAFLAELRVWSLETTPGGNRATITPDRDRPSILVLSAGLEDPRDLLDDVERGLRASADAAVPTDQVAVAVAERLAAGRAQVEPSPSIADAA